MTVLIQKYHQTRNLSATMSNLNISDLDVWLQVDDVSEPWSPMSCNDDISWQFLPPTPKPTMMLSSSALLPSAPLPIPSPPPKRGRYPLATGSSPLPVPDFRPPMVTRPIAVNRPPVVNRPKLIQVPVQTAPSAFPISRPVKVSASAAVTARTKFPSQCQHGTTVYFAMHVHVGLSLQTARCYHYESSQQDSYSQRVRSICSFDSMAIPIYLATFSSGSH